MSEFFVSVIIPTFNRATTLRRAIDSVLSQTRTADELIVVDDGSTDDTQSLLKNNYPDIIVIRQENNGISATRNVGIKRASGNWIALLDSDDSWHAEKLEKQIAALSNENKVALCHTNENWYQNDALLHQQKKHKKYGGYIFQHCLPRCLISPSSSLIKKAVFTEVGLFDQTLPACEDYDMWLRICSRYPVLFLDDAVTNKFGGHSDQLSKKYWGMDRFRIMSLQKIIESGILNEMDRIAAINMLQQKINIFLKGTKKHGRNQYCDQFEALANYYA